jgi:predicted AAA+ superfamily ATPase
VVNQRVDPLDWYASYLQSYLEKDVRMIQHIGNLRDFHRFLLLLAGRCAQILNMSALANDIGGSVPTVKQWLSVLEASFLIHLLPPYYEHFGKRIVKSPKVYFLDTGLVCYLLGLHTPRHVTQGPYAGALFENYCVQEVLKERCHRRLHANVFYWRSHQGTEVDVVMEEGQHLSLLECKFLKTPRVSMAQGLEAFLSLGPRKSVTTCQLLCLVDEPVPLSRHVVAQSVFDLFGASLQ